MGRGGKGGKGIEGGKPLEVWAGWSECARAHLEVADWEVVYYMGIRDSVITSSKCSLVVIAIYALVQLQNC
jgi:hypothetical protein